MEYKPIVDFIRSLYPNRENIPLHEPWFGGNEKKYVQDCIDSTFVSSVGKYVTQFEEMIRDYTGAKYAVATVNGTAALHVSLLLAGVKPGDLVITQPLTFIATCNAIKYCSADPVFVDVDRDTLGMSPESLESWLAENAVIEDGVCYFKQVHELDCDTLDHGIKQVKGSFSKHATISQSHCKESLPVSHKFLKIREIRGLKKISACVPMHTFGHPCRIDRIVEICQSYHIPVVEDAAESIGSYYRDRHTGTFGKLGTLSFNGNKTITTGGGGMIITNDDELGTLAKHLTTTAKKAHPWEFFHDMVGYNYRMPNINAALGCAQMEMLDKMLAGKRKIADQYQNFFQDFTDVEFVTEPREAKSNFWLNAILLPDTEVRDEMLAFLHQNRILARPAWLLMNQLPMFRSAISAPIPHAQDIAGRLVNLPSSYRSDL